MHPFSQGLGLERRRLSRHSQSRGLTSLRISSRKSFSSLGELGRTTSGEQERSLLQYMRLTRGIGLLRLQWRSIQYSTRTRMHAYKKQSIFETEYQSVKRNPSFNEYYKVQVPTYLSTYVSTHILYRLGRPVPVTRPSLLISILE